MVTGKHAQGGCGAKRVLIHAVVVYLDSSCHLRGIDLGENNIRSSLHLPDDRTVRVSEPFS